MIFRTLKNFPSAKVSLMHLDDLSLNDGNFLARKMSRMREILKIVDKLEYLRMQNQAKTWLHTTHILMTCYASRRFSKNKKR